MAPLTPLRQRAPWVAGALLLALVGLPVLAAGLRVGWSHWPWLLGAVAILLLLAGRLERWWQSRPLTHSSPGARSKARARFRVVDGGRAGRGRLPEAEAEDESDEPKWLM